MAPGRQRNPSKDERRKHKKLSTEAPTLAMDRNPRLLAIEGPIIETTIGIAQAHHDALIAAGKPIPSPIRCRLLVDTGADGCVLRHDIADKAGLKLISTNVPIHGVGVDTTGRIFMGRIYFVVESQRVAGAVHTCTLETQILSGTLKDSRFDGLLGRDALQFFDLSYNGRTGRVVLRYLK